MARPGAGGRVHDLVQREPFGAAGRRIHVAVTEKPRGINNNALGCFIRQVGQGMAYFGITATDAGLQAAAGGDVAAGLERHLRSVSRGRAGRHPGARLQVPSRAAGGRSAPLAVRLPPRAGRLAGAELAGGPRDRRRQRRNRARHRLRLAGGRLASREPARLPGAPASRWSTTGRRRSARGWRRWWRWCSGWRRAGRSTCWRIRSAHGWRLRPCRTSRGRRSG